MGWSGLAGDARCAAAGGIDFDLPGARVGAVVRADAGDDHGISDLGMQIAEWGNWIMFCHWEEVRQSRGRGVATKG